MAILGLRSARPPDDLAEAFEREVLEVESVTRAEIEADAGVTADVVLAWVPAGVDPDALFPLVAWKHRDARRAIVGCAPEGDAQDSEHALAAGLDDFVAGRAWPRELAVRIRAIARRMDSTDASSAVVRHGALTVDPSQHLVWVRGRRVELTPTEAAVMRVLVEGRGRPSSREELLDAAWGEDRLEVGDRAVDNVIMRLRRKLGEPRWVATVRGVGFRAVADVHDRERERRVRDM